MKDILSIKNCLKNFSFFRSILYVYNENYLTGPAFNRKNKQNRAYRVALNYLHFEYSKQQIP